MAQISRNQEQENPNSPWSNLQNDAVHEEDEENDLYPFQCDPLSPGSFFHPFSDTDSNPDSIQYPDSNPDSDSDQMNFVTDLFSPRDQYPRANFRSFELETHFHDNLGFREISQLGQLSQITPPIGPDSSIGGLRVVGFESDSDSEAFVRDDDPFGDPGVPLFWDGAQFDEQTGQVNPDLEWEEVGDQRVLERDGLGSVIERIEELSVSSEISNIEREETGEGDGVRDLEWEFLLAVNNLERNLEFENESFGEYDELFGQFMQNGAGPKGSPPTAKSFVENLPVVVMSEKEIKEENVICAVCKDDLKSDDSVTRLPCSHLYHGECIVPWLYIRNTCPVCRYELPTDDPDYERRKNHEGNVGFSQELLIRYAFEPIF